MAMSVGLILFNLDLTAEARCSGTVHEPSASPVRGNGQVRSSGQPDRRLGRRPLAGLVFEAEP
jgi:hypothetical protein